MTDNVERLRKLAEDLIALDLDMRLPPGSLNPHFAADEMARLRLTVASLEKRLADAKKVIEPFARLAGEYDPPEDDDNDLPFDLCHGDMTIGQLRAARAYLESST